MAKKIAKAAIKKFIKEGLKRKGKISKKSIKRHRTGKQTVKSNIPEVQAMIDEVYGIPLKIVKPIKKTHGGLAIKGEGRAFIKGER
tara:strand:+ start:820 stop:1077 length:258 start_codon:yes stop_codon:yes gene_type:complete